MPSFPLCPPPPPPASQPESWIPAGMEVLSFFRHFNFLITCQVMTFIVFFLSLLLFKQTVSFSSLGKFPCISDTFLTSHPTPISFTILCIVRLFIEATFFHFKKKSMIFLTYCNDLSALRVSFSAYLYLPPASAWEGSVDPQRKILQGHC